jgi:small conductance mechanosensitive channel
MDKKLEANIEQNIAMITSLADTVIDFIVKYGFQILGALIVLVIGLKIAGWLGRKAERMALAKDIDITLSKFMGNVVKVLLVVMVIIITLGNFGITIAPLIALAGASAFGATMALQGPLSNYGAGLAIILGRPFVVGNTITVRKVSGVVDEIALAATTLVGEDGERITIPNKQIVGEILVNSDERRVIETRLCIAEDQNPTKAIEIVREALGGFPELAESAPPQVGVHDFTYGGVIIGARYWVPSMKYFNTRYRVNEAVLRALADSGITLMKVGNLAMTVPPLTADEPEPEES